MKRIGLLVALTCCTPIDGGSHDTRIAPDAGDTADGPCGQIGDDCIVHGLAGRCVTGLLDTAVCAQQCSPSGQCPVIPTSATSVWQMQPIDANGVCVCR